HSIIDDKAINGESEIGEPENEEPSAKKTKIVKTCQHCEAPISINASQKCANCGKKQNKCCQHCMKPMTSNAAKQCHLCGKRQLTKAERMGTLDDAGPKGTIDQSAQRSIIRTRLNLLHKKENNHCIVLYLSGEQRIHVDSYATPGFAKHFMEGLSIGGNLFGDVIKDTFKTAYKEYQKTDTGNSVQTSTLDASDASQSSFSAVSSRERNPNDTGLSISEPATTVTGKFIHTCLPLCSSC
uniref:Uncharacterized protein n=1 Tax=Clytia hemisphaerica TaxID=252671 RepID=A0A7M5XQC8_9CNID